MARTLHVKWRPRKFADVVGQEKVAQVLKRSVVEGKVAQAYLFSGPRGVGKTTTARILAKALNCESLVDGEPCGKCQMCVDIDKGRLPDVVEMDAASHTGIDDIRELIQAAKYPPTKAKKKVFIIDEVHMLSTKAFNALLKTLEEPPPHVVFVLATTEPEKIPPTVRSRCQHFHFQLLPVNIVARHLMKVASAEGIAIDEPAAFMIAMASGGSLRDALVMLEQAWLFASGSEEKRITEKIVEESLSLSSVEIYAEFLKRVASGDYLSVVKFVSKLSSSGKNPLQFVRDLIVYLREALSHRLRQSLKEGEGASLSSVVPRREWFFDLLSDSIKDFSDSDVMRMLDYAFVWEKDVRYSPYPAISLEVGAYRFTLVAHIPTVEEILYSGKGLEDVTAVLSEDLLSSADKRSITGKKGMKETHEEHLQGDAFEADTVSDGGEKELTASTNEENKEDWLSGNEFVSREFSHEQSMASSEKELTPEDVKKKLNMFFRARGILTLRAAINSSQIKVDKDRIVISFSSLGVKGAVERHRKTLQRAVKDLFGKDLVVRYDGEEKVSGLIDSPTVDKIISLFDGTIIKVKEEDRKGG